MEDKPQTNAAVVDHITNMDLISLHIRNLNKIIEGLLNIYSIRNKFNFFAPQVKGNIDVPMMSETKFNEDFPAGWFLIDGYSFSFRFDRDGNGSGILLYITEDIYHLKSYQLIKTLRFFA